MRNTLLRVWVFCSLPAAASMGLFAQNLLPNAGFDEVSACPDNWEQVELATGWSKYRGSADLFNACSPGTYFGVPINLFGTHDAADGEGYVGMYCYLAGLENKREYVGAALAAPLTPNVPVQVSFKVASAGGGGGGFNMDYWCSGIGIKFSMSSWYEQEQITTISNEADVFSDQVIPYSAGWTTVSGIFVPDSAYTHVVVGNFFGDDMIVVQPATPPGNTPGAYYFVDDICITENLVAGCALVAGLGGESASSSPYAFFDPADGMIHVLAGANGAGSTLALIDASGRLIRDQRINPGTSGITLSARDLSSGLYVVSVMGNDLNRSIRVVIP